MTSNEYRKRIEPYVILENNLMDIETYFNGALNYIESDNKENYDLEELITYLSCVPEIVEEIRYVINEYFELKNS